MDLVGRDHPLAVLRAALDRARAGTGQVVAVTGDAGIGKTALAARFLADLPRGVVAVQGACDDLLTPRPLAPFHDIAAQTGGDLDDLLLDGAGRDRVHRALVEMLSRLPPPPVVLLEDLHWADEATLDALTLLGRRIRDRAMLLLVTYRDREVGPDHRLTRVLGRLPAGHLTTLSLDPLTRHDVSELASGRDVDIDRLHALTGGNPFFVTEVLSGSDLTVPPSVGLAVTANVAQLPRATRDLLQLVALVPARIEVDALDRLAPDWTAVLEPAEALGVVHLRGTALSFRHELSRHAVAETVSPMLARRHHARILEVLTELGADPADLVHHAEGAGDLDAMATHACLAAATAHRAESHREAVAHYRRALSREHQFEPAHAQRLWYGLARACMAADVPEDTAVEAARRAVEIARGLGDDFALGRSLASMSRLASWAGDNPLARRLASEALDLLEPLGDSRELAEAMNAQTYVELAAWSFPAATEWASRLRELGERMGEPKIEALGRVYLGVVRIAVAGDQTLFDDAVDAAIAAGNHLGAVEGFMTATTAHAFRHDHRQATALLDRGLAYATEHEYMTWRNYMRAMRAKVLAESGAWDAACREIEDALRTMRAGGWPRASALLVRGRLAARRGEASAREQLDAAWRMARPYAAIQVRYAAAAALAELAWLEDRLDEPPPELLEVAEQAHAGPWREVRGEIGLWLHRAGADPGDPTRMAAPFRLLVEGRHAEAAEAWSALGCVYEAAEAAVLSDEPDAVREGLEVLDRLGAAPLARRARARLRALGVRPPQGPQTAARRHPAGLTPRQDEVLRLLATGATNAEIAERLVVSVRTVDHHVSAVLQKLGVSSRGEAVAAASSLGVR